MAESPDHCLDQTKEFLAVIKQAGEIMIGAWYEKMIHNNAIVLTNKTVYGNQKNGKQPLIKQTT